MREINCFTDGGRIREATNGTVTVFEQKPKDVIRNSNDIAFVFQEANLLPWRTVYDNVVLPLELRGTDKKVRKKRLKGYWRWLD